MIQPGYELANTYVYIYCHGCEAYIAKHSYPQSYGWCQTWLRQNCTVEIIEERRGLPVPSITPCSCAKQRSLI